MARGHERVVVVAIRVGAGSPLDAEIATLKAAGAQVALITPNPASLAAMGANLMDFRARGPAAQAGLAQAEVETATLAAFWI